MNNSVVASTKRNVSLIASSDDCSLSTDAQDELFSTFNNCDDIFGRLMFLGFESIAYKVEQMYGKTFYKVRVTKSNGKNLTYIFEEVK